MKILITGANGQLGQEVSRLIPDASRPGRNEMDMADPGAVGRTLDEIQPDLIFNCAAMTDVDGCEKDRNSAYMINSVSPSVIAQYCIKTGARVVHFSTDYVFDGTRGMYTEEDAPDPVNYYGLSKILGDFAVIPLSNSLIIRTSGVFGEKMNFPLFVYTSLRDRKEINAIESSYSPVNAANLARASVEVERKGLSGILNIAGDRISRYEMALGIARFFGMDESLVRKGNKIPGGIARRPFDSSLDISRATKLLDWDFHSLESNISRLDVH